MIIFVTIKLAHCQEGGVILARRERKDRVLRKYLTGPIDHKEQRELCESIDDFAIESANQGRIIIFMNSPGGIAECAEGIYDYIKACPLRINTVVQGEVGSAAVIVFLAGQERLISKNSIIAFHRPWKIIDHPMFQEDFCYAAEDLGKIEERMLRIICEITSQNEEVIKADLKKFRIFTAEEAIKYGLAHKII